MTATDAASSSNFDGSVGVASPDDWDGIEKLYQAVYPGDSASEWGENLRRSDNAAYALFHTELDRMSKTLKRLDEKRSRLAHRARQAELA